MWRRGRYVGSILRNGRQAPRTLRFGGAGVATLAPHHRRVVAQRRRHRRARLRVRPVQQHLEKHENKSINNSINQSINQ